jgi:hypothetical protein
VTECASCPVPARRLRTYVAELIALQEFTRLFLFGESWSDDLDGREVRPVPADIAGQQPVARHGGMRANIEVRHWQSLVTISVYEVTAAPAG